MYPSHYFSIHSLVEESNRHRGTLGFKTAEGEKGGGHEKQQLLSLTVSESQPGQDRNWMVTDAGMIQGGWEVEAINRFC